MRQMASNSIDKCCFKNCSMNHFILLSKRSKLKFHHCCIAEFNVKFSIDEGHEICPFCCASVSLEHILEAVLGEYYGGGADTKAENEMDEMYEQFQEKNVLEKSVAHGRGNGRNAGISKGRR